MAPRAARPPSSGAATVTVPPVEQESPVQSEWPDKPAGPPPPKRGALSFLKELPILILIAFGLALLIKTFLVQAFYIPSESMLPTLEVGDRVLVNKLVYRFREPRRGEIIVFVAEHDTERRTFWRKVKDVLTEGLGVATPREKDFIKRVIGLPGETIQVRRGTVTITRGDGSAFTLSERYVAEEEDLSEFGPFRVPADSFFVMGDNRPNSADSRTRLGPIKRRDIVGKAFVRIWPLNRTSIMRTPKYAPPDRSKAAAALLPLGIPVAAMAFWRRRGARLL
jgi:signal peptidase I